MIETFRPILNLPWAYQMWGSVVGSDGYRKTLATEHIRAKQSDKILDVGCGPGSMVPYLPRSEYVGFDANPDYIQQARRRFPFGSPGGTASVRGGSNLARVAMVVDSHGDHEGGEAPICRPPPDGDRPGPS